MARTRIDAIRRRRALAKRVPSRAVRRENSATPPRAAALAMAKLTTERLTKFEAVIERLLFPVLERFAVGGEVESEPDEPDAKPRVDLDEARLRNLYGDEAFDAEPVERTDAIPRYVSARLEAIDLNIEAIFAESELLNGLEVIGERVSVKGGTAIRRVVGISIYDAAPEIASQINNWRALNVSRIKSLAGTELVEITKILEASGAAGLRVEVLEKEIRKRFGVTKSKANLLARDQTLTLNAQIAKTRQQAAGVSEYIWTTSGDERVRGNDPNDTTDHVALEGTRHRWDTPPDVGDGRRLHPGEDYQCRCTAFPVLPELA